MSGLGGVLVKYVFHRCFLNNLTVIHPLIPSNLRRQVVSERQNEKYEEISLLRLGYV